MVTMIDYACGRIKRSPLKRKEIQHNNEVNRSKANHVEVDGSMGEVLFRFQSCSPAQGRRSSSGQDPRIEKTEEGLVLLTSEAERRKLREL